MKTVKPALLVLVSVFLFQGCRERRDPGKVPEPTVQQQGNNPRKENVPDEGRPEVSNDPGDSRSDGNSRTSPAVAPSPSNEHPLPKGGSPQSR
jgi:hypothetical protein